MKDTPAHQSRRTRTASETYANRTLGGLVVFATFIPVVIALVAAPVLVGAFALGVGTGAVLRRRARSPETDTNDSPTQRDGRPWT